MFRLPAEWEPQSGVLLTWPLMSGDWGDSFIRVEATFVEIAANTSQFQRVLIVIPDPQSRPIISERLQRSGANLANTLFSIAPSNDCWARDHGPITVIENNQAALLDFEFDGWGGKYPAELDNNITRRIIDQGGFATIPCYSPGFVLEGGSIESDGCGTLLSTERCLIRGQRNPQYTRTEIETRLKHWFGLDRILWLNSGYLPGDDTDAHIDTLARFCNPSTIAYVSPPENRIETRQLQQMEAELGQFKQQNHRTYRLVPLPSPAVQTSSGGKRLPATYANFLILNGAVLVPSYRDPADEIAQQCLQDCFPDRKIIPIDCSALIEQFGSLHCVTMQLPTGVLS